MRELKDRVHVIRAADIGWPFGEDPCFQMKGPEGWAHTCKIDPFPCYGHSPELVAEIAERVEALFPIGFQVDYFLPEYEGTDRVNGFAMKQDLWGEQKDKPWPFEPLICLSGKRIPLHPAMTRYLVGHEYGHIAEYWLEHVRKLDSREIRNEYARMRPGSNANYGGGKWHANTGELFANDFRILVCGLEPEFWPHSGFPHPSECPEIKAFWEQATTEAKEAARPSCEVAA